jgi:CRISPR-associated protein Csx10
MFIGGYSTAWGLPKPTGLGVAPGSTYVYHTDMNDDLVSWLESLENHGIGLRAEEGLGEILICHPFHEEVKPV